VGGTHKLMWCGWHALGSMRGLRLALDLHLVPCMALVLLVRKLIFFVGGGRVFQDRVSVCSPGYPGTHFVDQAVLELRNPSASASQVLGLKLCATTAGLGKGDFCLLRIIS
jgi:hypothetical protein